MVLHAFIGHSQTRPLEKVLKPLNNMTGARQSENSLCRQRCDFALPETTASELENGYMLSIPARNGVVLKLK